MTEANHALQAEVALAETPLTEASVTPKFCSYSLIVGGHFL